MKEEEKYTRKIKQKWTRWLKKDLFSEFWYLLKLKKIYEIMLNIFKNAEKYPENNWSYWYVKHTYTDAIIASIYRITDMRSRKDVISLYRLLNEVKDNRRLISRKAYTRITGNKWKNSIYYGLEKDRLNNEFTQVAAGGAYIRPSIVRRDISQIKKIYKEIKNFRHKFVAHHAYDQRRYRKIPTFPEVNDFVKQLYDIFSKYYLLITGGAVVINIDRDEEEIKADLAAIFK